MQPFSLHEVQIEYLASHPKWIALIAQWTYNSWHKYDPTLTVENSIEDIKGRLNTDKVPLTMVAIYSNKPIATANLKLSIPVINAPKNKIWLGSFYVEPEYRNKGVGGKLLDVICSKAISLGYKEVYLFTSATKVVPWYEKHGWKLIKKLPFQNHLVAIMCWEQHFL